MQPHPFALSPRRHVEDNRNFILFSVFTPERLAIISTIYNFFLPCYVDPFVIYACIDASSSLIYNKW